MAHDESAYAAGYRAGRKHETDTGVAVSSLKRLLHVASRLENHSSVYLMKHEIKRELEALGYKKDIGMSM